MDFSDVPFDKGTNVILDFEGTDKTPYTTCINQVALVVPKTGQAYSAYVRANVESCYKAQITHRIDPKKLESADTFPQVFESMCIFLKDMPRPIRVIAHNGFGYDYKLLLSEMTRAGIPGDRMPFDMLLDSMVWSKTVAPKELLSISDITGKPEYGNTALYKALVKKAPKNAHDALADCWITWAVVEQLYALDCTCILKHDSTKTLQEWLPHATRLVQVNLKQELEQVKQKLAPKPLMQFFRPLKKHKANVEKKDESVDDTPRAQSAGSAERSGSEKA